MLKILEFGMYPQSMPTEWTHVRTVRAWQSVRLDLWREQFCEWKDVAAYYFLRTINRRLDLRGL